MKRAVQILAVVLAIGTAMATALAQGEIGATPEPEKYTLDLPTGWEKATFVDGAKITRREYVYGDRLKGLLKIRPLRVEAGQTPENTVAHDVDTSLKFLPGFVQGRNEQFGGGALPGYLVQFDFTRGGKPMLGRYYYMAGADGTVWVLQFTGDRMTLGQIRNLTDQIARSFQPIQAK